MAESYDWSTFHETLRRHGPQLLLGIDDPDLLEIIEITATTTDSFWSDGLQSLLADGAGRGDMRSGVLAVLELWRENVLTVLADEFITELDWGLVAIDTESPLVDELVQAATPDDP